MLNFPSLDSFNRNSKLYYCYLNNLFESITNNIGIGYTYDSVNDILRILINQIGNTDCSSQSICLSDLNLYFTFEDKYKVLPYSTDILSNKKIVYTITNVAGLDGFIFTLEKKQDDDPFIIDSQVMYLGLIPSGGGGGGQPTNTTSASLETGGSGYNRTLELPNYSTTKGYTPGKLVIYDNNLYKCLINTTGTWTPTNWQLIGSSGGGQPTDITSTTLETGGSGYNKTLELPNYSTTNNYSPGKIVIYNNSFYKCLNNTTGTWKPTDWQLIGSTGGGGVNSIIAGEFIKVTPTSGQGNVTIDNEPISLLNLHTINKENVQVSKILFDKEPIVNDSSSIVFDEGDSTLLVVPPPLNLIYFDIEPIFENGVFQPSWTQGDSVWDRDKRLLTFGTHKRVSMVPNPILNEGIGSYLPASFLDIDNKSIVYIGDELSVGLSPFANNMIKARDDGIYASVVSSSDLLVINGDDVNFKPQTKSVSNSGGVLDVKTDNLSILRNVDEELFIDANTPVSSANKIATMAEIEAIISGVIPLGGYFFGVTGINPFTVPNPTHVDENYYDFTTNTPYTAKSDLTGWTAGIPITPVQNNMIYITSSIWDIDTENDGGEAIFTVNGWVYIPIIPVGVDNLSITKVDNTLKVITETPVTTNNKIITKNDLPVQIPSVVYLERNKEIIVGQTLLVPYTETIDGEVVDYDRTYQATATLPTYTGATTTNEWFDTYCIVKERELINLEEFEKVCERGIKLFTS